MNKRFALFSLFFMFLATINTFGDVPELIRAADDGNLDKVRELIAAGVDVNAVDVFGRTALIVAAQEGSLENVWLLVEAGADIHAKSEIITDPGYPTKWTDAIDEALWYSHPEIVRFLVDNGALTAVLNDSDVRLRDRPTTEGSNTVGMLQKGGKVTVLGRSESKVPIGGMNDYWLLIVDGIGPHGPGGYSYGAFFDLTSLSKEYIPVFQEIHTEPPWRVWETFRANFEEVYFGSNLGQDQRFSWFEEIRIISERDVQFFKGESVKEDGTWSRLGGWIMLRLRGFESYEDAVFPVEYPLFLEWRSDLGGFLKAEDVTRIEREKYILNREENRFEFEDRQHRECIGYFTWVYSR